MSNESSNFPTAAVISGRQATGGSDMATQSLTLVDSPLPVHVLCHDPYAWFSQRGQRLHGVSISILPSPRRNGVLYTGTFNIDGFIYTVGSPSIDGLYYEAMQKRCRHLQSIDRHQARKRTRCALRFMERYPEAELPLWLASSEN